jgi:hypothetical protein
MKKHNPNDTSENRIIGFTGGWIDLNAVPIEKRWANLPAEKRTERQIKRINKPANKPFKNASEFDFAEIIAKHFQLRKKRGRYQWRLLNSKCIIASSHDYMIAQRRLCAYIQKTW